jgi:hypothetical protein
VSAKFAGALPKGGANGLQQIAAEMVETPWDVRVAVIFFDCSKVTKDMDSGETVPTARIRRIEVIDDPADGNRLRQVLRRAWERRTGEDVLPIDMEDELNAVFGRDPELPT